MRGSGNLNAGLYYFKTAGDRAFSAHLRGQSDTHSSVYSCEARAAIVSVEIGNTDSWNNACDTLDYKSLKSKVLRRILKVEE